MIPEQIKSLWDSTPAAKDDGCDYFDWDMVKFLTVCQDDKTTRLDWVLEKEKDRAAVIENAPSEGCVPYLWIMPYIEPKKCC